jgi:ankyrin repeat protein
VFCQLETLQQCLPQSLRRTLNELPESLDGTYERVMMEIKRANQSHAYRMLQCLTVANRPLTVAELAEILAFDFDEAKGGIPKLNSNWRWEDHEQAVLSTCSSLVTVVPDDESPIVQFSHFSVKEFLMSDRLATSKRHISQYHISLLDAHTLLAQASLAVLLRDPPDANGHTDSAVLAEYAAEHWMTHARLEDVASQVRDGMEDLFDPDKPHFEAWIQLYDIDADDGDDFPTTPEPEPGARPLYYAALCGFLELVEHLNLKYPQYGTARGGLCGTALHSASLGGHLHVVRYLLRHGIDVNVRVSEHDTSLLLASWKGHSDVVRCLLEHGADVDLRDNADNTPLTLAAHYGYVDVVRILLEHNATVNSQDKKGQTPMHDVVMLESFKADRLQIARLLLKHGANPNARNDELQTPLHLVSWKPELLDVLRVMLEHGADPDAEDNDGKTPVQLALDGGHDEVTRLLSGYSSKPTSQ